MIKSAAEIALLQRPTTSRSAAIKIAFGKLREGMSQQEVAADMSARLSLARRSGRRRPRRTRPYSAFPHGPSSRRKLREGDIVRIDSGCHVEGYESDITRTTVFGKPSRAAKLVWGFGTESASAAFAAAQVARRVNLWTQPRARSSPMRIRSRIQSPWFPHRTGHGIGLTDTRTNFVKGNKTRSSRGCVFSDEPMITNYDEFGVRLEDASTYGKRSEVFHEAERGNRSAFRLGCRD